MASSSLEQFAELEVDCSNKNTLGCRWKGNLKNLESHLQCCEKALLKKVIIRLSNCEDELVKIRKENVYIKTNFELKISDHYDERFAKKCKELSEMNLQLGQLRKDVDAARKENEDLRKEVEDLKSRSPGKDQTKKETENLQKELELEARSPKADAIPSPVNTFLDITIGNKRAGRLIINLFPQAAPLTCEKFVKLVTTGHEGVGYQGVSFSYVDSTGCTAHINYNALPNNTLPPELITPCENRSGKHNRRGVVTIANEGNTTKTQFFITFKALPHWDGRLVIIGEVAQESWPVLDKMEQQQGTPPKLKIEIVSCGVC